MAPGGPGGEPLYFPYVDTVDYVIDTTHACEPCLFAGEIVPALTMAEATLPEGSAAPGSGRRPEGGDGGVCFPAFILIAAALSAAGIYRGLNGLEASAGPFEGTVEQIVPIRYNME